MKTIKNENLLEELQNLNVGESIFIPLSEDFCNVIKLNDIQMQSYNNLFMSYLNNTCEEANKLNLDKFMNMYTLKYANSELLKSDVLALMLDDATEYFNNNAFKYLFNYTLNILEISKMEVKL